MRVLFFDTETTGFKGSRIVQLGALLQDTETKRVLTEFNAMVLTEGVEIPEAVVEIHGISNEIADAYGFDKDHVDAVFARMIELADVVVAHNIDFDLNIIQTNLPKSQALIIAKEHYCTMLNSMNMLKIPGRFGKFKWPKLIESYKFFFDGQEFDNAHDAMADVRACRDVYFALNDKLDALRGGSVA